MKKRNTNALLMVGVVIAIILLMVWLFLGTTLEEDESINPLTIEQTN